MADGLDPLTVGVLVEGGELILGTFIAAGDAQKRQGRVTKTPGRLDIADADREVSENRDVSQFPGWTGHSNRSVSA